MKIQVANIMSVDYRPLAACEEFPQPNAPLVYDVPDAVGQHILRLQSHIEALNQTVSRLRATLYLARKIFRDYADHHAAKGATEKATRNRELEILCNEALKEGAGE